MPIAARQNVEALFVGDFRPDNARATYLYIDSQVDREVEIDLTVGIDDLDDLRFGVVQAIMTTTQELQGPLSHFTLLLAHETFANRDLVLRAFLVNPKMAQLLNVLEHTFWGAHIRVYVHPEIPVGEIYGLADPEFVGIVAIQDGMAGMRITNPQGVVWGHFQTVWDSV